MRTSLFSLLVTSPLTLGYDAPWLKEANDLTRAAGEAERQTREADPSEGEGRLYSVRPNRVSHAGWTRPL